MNTRHIKLLADKMAMEYVRRDLYKPIAESSYWRAKRVLHEAIDELEARIKDAFFDGYDARKYYYEDETTNVLEEWNKYNAISTN